MRKGNTTHEHTNIATFKHTGMPHEQIQAISRAQIQAMPHAQIQAMLHVHIEATLNTNTKAHIKNATCTYILILIQTRSVSNATLTQRQCFQVHKVRHSDTAHTHKHTDVDSTTWTPHTGNTTSIESYQ